MEFATMTAMATITKNRSAALVLFDIISPSQVRQVWPDSVQFPLGCLKQRGFLGRVVVTCPHQVGANPPGCM